MSSNPTCPVCGNEVVPQTGQGRPREYDTPDCKKRAYYCRINGLPITEAKHQDRRDVSEKDLASLVRDQAYDMQHNTIVWREKRLFLEELNVAPGQDRWEEWFDPVADEYADPTAEMAFEQDL